ncbi:MAG: aldehyde dehydrogenase [Planctomycetes bacterium]|nr:aldehyde dehydrogenase [Planctomycetota bacterium]
MIHFPILRWGEAYRSLETDTIHHCATGEPLAEVSQTNAGLIERDMRHAARARDVLREIHCAELLRMCARAADLFMNATLPVGDAAQTPDDFVRCQSGATGIPEHVCRMNMQKLHHVLTNLEAILNSLMRGLDFETLTRGYGMEHGLIRSYQANAPVLGIVLPSNSPGVHGLWLPIIPLQIGLVLKPGPQEPWTPWRMTQAFFQAGIPKQSIAIYPGGSDAGAAVLARSPRSLIFGSTATVERYRAEPTVRVHGPGFSKILIGDDEADHWEKYLDLMVTSVFINSGRGCINCSGIWAPCHTREIADALARRLGPIHPLPLDHPDASLAAFTVKGQAEAIHNDIEAALREPGTEDVTSKYRDGDRLVRADRCDYLRPTVVHCDSPGAAIAKKEYLFPFVSIVRCPQEEMIGRIGPTLVATAITGDEKFRRSLLDARNIDRLNVGPVPTTQINWLQPHEGNIVDFLFRARALQMPALEGVK